MSRFAFALLVLQAGCSIGLTRSASGMGRSLVFDGISRQNRSVAPSKLHVPSFFLWG